MIARSVRVARSARVESPGSPEARQRARVNRINRVGPGPAPQASRICPSRRTTGGSTLHGKLIHSSVRFHTYSHFTSDCDFS